MQPSFDGPGTTSRLAMVSPAARPTWEHPTPERGLVSKDSYYLGAKQCVSLAIGHGIVFESRA